MITIKEVFYGTHGTRSDYIEGIVSSSFNTGIGLAGTGVYFWEWSDYAMELARDWYNHHHKKDILTDSSIKCAIISVGMEVPTLNYLDFEESYFKAAFLKVARHNAINNGTSKEILTKIYDDFVVMMEEIFSTEYFVWRVGVSKPKGSNYPEKRLSNPICIITDRSSLIEIIDIKIEE